MTELWLSDAFSRAGGAVVTDHASGLYAVLAARGPAAIEVLDGVTFALSTAVDDGFEAALARAPSRGDTTCSVAAVLFRVDRAIVAHVGDCRVQLIRDGTAFSTTRDHSLLQDYIEANGLTDEEIDNFPHKDILHRALGMDDSTPDIHDWPVRIGDWLLLTTSRLHSHLTLERMMQGEQSAAFVGGDGGPAAMQLLRRDR